MTRLITTILVALTLSAGTLAQSDAEPDQSVTPSLITQHTGWLPGHTEIVGVHLDIAPGWHTYWRGRNDSGFPVKATLTLPDGFTHSEMRWQAPQRHIAPGDVLDHVYEDETTLLFFVDVPADATPGQTVTIKADLEWLECKEFCRPGYQTVTLTIPIVSPDSSEQARSDDADAINKAIRALPKPAAEAPQPITINATDSRVTITAEGASNITLLVDEDSTLLPTDLIKQGDAEGDTLMLDVQQRDDKPARLLGILAVKRSGGNATEYYDIETGTGLDNQGR